MPKSASRVFVPAMLAAVLALAPSLRAQDEEVPPVPEEVLKSYLAAAEQTDWYREFKPLELESFSAEVDRWARDLGVQVQLSPTTFLSLLSERGVTLDGGRNAMLLTGWVTKGGAEMLTLAVGDARYRVDRRQLAPLDFTYVEVLAVFDPANVRRDRFVSAGDTLESVVYEMCQLGDLDFSLRSDLASQAKVSLDVRNKTVTEILTLAAHAAGWQVQFRRAGQTHTMPPNMHFRALDVLYDLDTSWRRADEPVDGSGRRVRNRLEALIKEAAERIKEDRPVVIVTPPEVRPATDD